MMVFLNIPACRIRLTRLFKDVLSMSIKFQYTQTVSGELRPTKL